MAVPVRFDQDLEGPPGAGTFAFDDGNALYAFDPELAATLAPRAEPDMRLAQNGAEFNAHASPQQPESRFDALSAIAPAPPAPAMPAPAPDTGGMQAFPVGQPGPGQAAPPAPEQVPMVRVPGRNPAREAATAVAVPKSVTTTIEQAPDTAEDREARRFLNDEFEAAQLAKVDTEVAIAERDREAAQVQRARLEEERVALAAEAAAKEERYKGERARAQAHLEAAEQKKVDPEHFFNSRSVPGKALLVVGQALGAFAASMPGGTGSNWAQQIIDGMIDRDVDAQAEEIRSGRVSASNRLARIQEDLGGDLEQAKTALKMTQQGIIDTHIRELAAEDKIGTVKAAADVWLAENQIKRQAEEQKFRDQSYGKQTVTAQMVTPSAGGVRPMTLKEQVEEKELRARGARADATVAAGGRNPDKGATTTARLQAEYGERRQGAENIIGQVNDVVSFAGGRVDKSGKITFPDDVPGIGPVASRLPDVLLSDQGQQVRQSLSNLAADVIKDKSGASVTEPERKALQQMLQGGFRSEDQLRNGLEIIQRYGQRKLKNVESSFPEDVRRGYRVEGGKAAVERLEDDEADVETL